jgi:hypothetical protein
MTYWLEINREGQSAGNPAICRLVCWKKHQDPKVLLEKVSRSKSSAAKSRRSRKFCSADHPALNCRDAAGHRHRHRHRQPPTANRQPPTAHRRPPTADRRPPTADRRPPTANRQPPTANRQPPTANRQPPIAPIFLARNIRPRLNGIILIRQFAQQTGCITMLSKDKPSGHNHLRTSSIMSPLAFLALTCVPTALAYFAISPEYNMGIPWTEIAICYGGAAFFGILLGLSIQPTTTLARRARYLSPLLPSFILTIGTAIESARGGAHAVEIMIIIVLMPLLFYILMAPTAGFFRLIQWLRQSRL